MTELREKMIRDMELRRLSASTKRNYLNAIFGLAKHYKRSPVQITDHEVQDYLLYLLNEKKLTWGTCNIRISGFRFFYKVTLGRESRIESQLWTWKSSAVFGGRLSCSTGAWCWSKALRIYLPAKHVH